LPPESLPAPRRPSALRSWLDADATPAGAGSTPDADLDRVDWLRIVPFLGLHAGCLAVLAVGFSPVAAAVAVGLYFVRMFAITAFYHRYFSHRAFKTSRAMQFVMAVVGNAAVQRGPLWWASHHRKHHRRSDMPQDVHSPVQHGLLWSHVGWFTTRRNHATDLSVVPDLSRYPELRFLDRFDGLVPLALAGALWGLGAWLAHAFPQLGTSGWQMLVWGFCLSTVVLFHATVTINSLSHRFGTRRYDTPDDSRNNVWLALLTMGEGWHNNHHHYPHSARQGFRWWELDPSLWILKLMALLGLVHDLKPVPESVVAAGRRLGKPGPARPPRR
jgi:stearoyl-CoA desaturase (delta-9 desaturase)